MRHRVYGRKLGRNKDQRKALFKNLVHALLTHKSIVTTEAKTKAIKSLVDKVKITRVGQRKGDGAMMVRMSLKGAK